MFLCSCGSSPPAIIFGQYLGCFLGLSKFEFGLREFKAEHYRTIQQPPNAAPGSVLRI